MKHLTYIAALSSAVLIAACGGSAPAEAPPSARTLKIAMIAKSSTNPVFLASRTGAEAAARELSEQHGITVEVVWLTPPQEDG
jgi:ribose transport system substrate-binding protein